MRRANAVAQKICLRMADKARLAATARPALSASAIGLPRPIDQAIAFPRQLLLLTN
jgi:hypothetical protein